MFLDASDRLPAGLPSAYPAGSVDGRPQRPPAGTAAAVADQPCTVGWGDPDTGFARSILSSVVSAGSQAWAVGLTTESEDPRYPLAVHWDGSAWDKMPIASSTQERALFGMDRSPSGRMWAVGYRTREHALLPDADALERLPMGGLVHGPHQQPCRGPAERPRSQRRAHVGSRLQDRQGRPATAWPSGAWVRRGGTTARTPRDRDRRAHGYRCPDQRRRLGRGLARQPRSTAAIPGALERWSVGHRQTGVVGFRGSPHRRWRWSRRTTCGRSATASWAVSIGRPCSAGTGEAGDSIPFPSVHSGVSVLRGVQIGSDGQPVVVGTRWDSKTGTWRGMAARRQGATWHVMDTPEIGTGHRAARPRDPTRRHGHRGGRERRSLAGHEPVPGAAGLDDWRGGRPDGTGPGTHGERAGCVAESRAECSPKSGTLVGSCTRAIGHPTRPAPKRTRAPRVTATPRPPVIVRDMTKAAGLDEVDIQLRRGARRLQRGWLARPVHRAPLQSGLAGHTTTQARHVRGCPGRIHPTARPTRLCGGRCEW